MIFLLHGDNITLLEKALLEFKKTIDGETLEFNAADITPPQFLDAARTFDIFQNPPFIVMRFEKSVDVQPYYELLDQVPKETKTVLVFPYSLGVTHILMKNPKKVLIKESSVAQKKNADIFRFVDSVFLQNRKLAHAELEALVDEKNDPFYIFSMILYGLRNIFYAKFNSPELATMKDFSKRKALSQAAKFEESEIIDLFAFMHDLDKKVKTGELPADLMNFLAVEKVLAYTKK
jgi:DNA polymerase III delta subunit